MLLELKPKVLGDIPLPFFNGLVYKLLNMSTIEADEMVMMLALI
jgi:hypothetical protein